MKKRRFFGKRLASAILAICLGVTPSMAALPSMTVLAAEGDDIPTGTVHITCVDSSVYGADRTSGNITTEMVKDVSTLGSKALKEYWSNSLTTYDFLHTPEGLGTFMKRTLEIYDVTKIGEDGSISKLPERNSYGAANHYDYSYLTGAKEDGNLGLTPAATVEMRGGGIELTNTRGPLGVSGGAKWAKKDHYYVIVEAPSLNDSIAGYSPNVDGTKKGWQCQFQWTDGVNVDLSYTRNVASKYANSEPLHNEVLRGGFSFSIYDKDMNQFVDQARGNLATDRENVVFAVYNINSSASARLDGRPENYGWKNDGTYTGGYVTVDSNGDNTIDAEESLRFIPAYTESEVIKAYNQYLMDCRDYTEDGKAKPKYNGNFSDDTSGQGEFIIGKNSANKEIIPAMILRPDEKGVVKTGNYALPVGNYLVLQVGTADGYYIDEDFRPIISIGPWYNDEGVQVSGYGRAYYPAIDNTIGTTHESAKGLGKISTTNPVAFCPTGSCTNLADITPNTFYVASDGSYVIGTGNPGKYGPVYAAGVNGPSGGNYIMNSNDNRMKPIAGNSKFNAYNAIVRGGTKVYLADADDLNDAANEHKYAPKNIDSDGKYLIIPQGNGSLNGAEFTLINKNDAPVKLYTTGGTLNPGDESGSITYTVTNNMLLIPVDDLAYGIYQIKQVVYGDGYKKDNTFLPYLLGIAQEDDVHINYTNNPDANYTNPGPGGSAPDIASKDLINKHTVAGRTYITNQIVDGGEIFSINSNSESAAGKSVKLSVYNISDHYVYVDKDGDGTKERYETNASEYQAQIMGKGLTYDKLNSIVGKWTACDEQTINVGSSVTKTDKLPYGTYLVVASGVPAGYDIIGEYMVVDTIDDDEDDIIFATRIEDQNTIPKLSTTLREVESKLDSVPIKNRVFFEDLVKMSNLQPGQDYALYGVLADGDTGDILKQGCVAYTTFSTYTPTDDGGTNTPITTGGGLDYLVAKGQTVTKPGEDAVLWGKEVQNYANTIKDATLIQYCSTFLGYAGGNVALADDKFFTESKNLIMGHLRFLGGSIGGSDASLTGAGNATVLFNWIDATDLEGKNLIAYEYLCNADVQANEDALLATTTGELLAVLDPELLAVHKDMADEEQTVHAPSLDITAEARYTGLKTIDSAEDVKATVTYGNVEIGNEYALKTWLVDEFGNDITMADVLDKNGEPVGSEDERYEITEQFKAYATSGDAEFNFEGLDMQKFNEQRLTAYSELSRVEGNAQNNQWWLVEKGDADSMGYSITDETPGKNQVDVNVPTIKTVLTDKYGNKDVDFDAKVSLKDTVSYKNLIPDASYKSTLTLVDIDGNALLDDDGNDLTATVEFKADAAEKTIEIPIEFNGKDIQGMEIVAYNDLYKVMDGHVQLVAQEHNLKASDQTINATGAEFRIMVSTIALDDTSRTHIIPATGEATATDTVTVKNLEPSTKYVAVTELADAKTGNIVSQFAPVETDFTTETDGTARFDVPMTFNASVFSGKKLVVYETIYDEGMKNVIAAHKNKNDANQTLSVPMIDTVATANDGVSKKIVPEMTEKNLTNAENSKKEKVYTAEIMDTITYTNLIPGNTYRITTEIASRDGKGGSNGSSIGTTTTEFTPTTSSGTTVTYITVDVTKYPSAKLVVFETITDVYSETEVVIHKDLTDEDQTVEIVGDEYLEDPEDPDDPDDPKDKDKDKDGKPDDGTDIQTGVAEHYMILFIIAGIMIIGCGVFGGIYLKKRRNN